MKKTASFLLLAGVILAGMSQFSCKSTPIEELKKSIELVDIQTKWVSKYYQPWPPRLILVPVVSFKIKNAGAKPLQHVFVNAIFQFKGDPENLGDQYLAVLRKNAVATGETSELITLKSNFGVEGKSLSSFKDHPLWKPTNVKIYVRLEGEKVFMVGEYPVSRIIDFKEPEPVEPKKDETKPNP